MICKSTCSPFVDGTVIVHLLSDLWVITGVQKRPLVHQILNFLKQENLKSMGVQKGRNYPKVPSAQ